METWLIWPQNACIEMMFSFMQLDFCSWCFFFQREDSVAQCANCAYICCFVSTNLSIIGIMEVGRWSKYICIVYSINLCLLYWVIWSVHTHARAQRNSSIKNIPMKFGLFVILLRIFPINSFWLESKFIRWWFRFRIVHVSISKFQRWLTVCYLCIIGIIAHRND